MRLILLLLALLATAGCDRQKAETPQGEAAESIPGVPTKGVDRSHKGKPAPDTVFHNPDGGDITLADFEGVPVLVNLWASWCAPCLKELPTLAKLEHEVFVALYLDAQNKLITTEELFRGTLTQTSVYPREVVKRTLKHNAAAVIFAHNHPSGIAEPSRADEMLTSTLRQALSLVDVKVLDHLIVAGSATVSFAERGLL